jgi:hypothetical protein
VKSKTKARTKERERKKERQRERDRERGKRERCHKFFAAQTGFLNEHQKVHN